MTLVSDLGIERPMAWAVLLFVVAHFAYARYLNHKRTLPLPPGPSRLPLVGNVHQLPLQYQQRTFTEWGKQYGEIVFAKFFVRPAIILNSLEVAQDLMEKRGSKYSDRPRFVLINELVRFKPMVFMSYTDEWRRQRKWYQTAIQARNAIDSYLPLQRRETNKFLLDLIQTPQAFENHVKRFSAAMMMEIAYGHSVSSVDDEFVKFADNALTGAIEADSLVATLVDFFPFLRHIPTWMPGSGFKRRAFIARQRVREMLDTPYDKVRREVAAGTAKPSFLTYLLDELSKDNEITPEDQESIKYAVCLMYGAGSDTTIITLLSFLLAMVLHPEVYRKAQAEIDRVVGSERLPELEDRPSLPYLECVLKEVYRWNPPAPLGVPHNVTHGDVYRDHYIPKGTMVIGNIWAMTRDPSMYPDPDTFLPERFENLDSETAEQCSPHRMVFGFGRRLCPGKQLGDYIIWLAAANMIATLDICKARNASGEEITPEAAFDSGAVSHPKHFECDIHPRSQKVADMVVQLNAHTT